MINATVGMLMGMASALTAVAMDKTPTDPMTETLLDCRLRIPSVFTKDHRDLRIRIMQPKNDRDYALVADVGGTDGGESREEARGGFEAVRRGLTATTPAEGLNRAEWLIVRAMLLTQDPQNQFQMAAGVDLADIATAQFYEIGPRRMQGAPTLVEARDSMNRVLGLFLAGFAVYPCLKTTAK